MWKSRALCPRLLIWTYLPLEPSDWIALTIGKSSPQIRFDKYNDPKMLMLEFFNVLRLNVFWNRSERNWCALRVLLLSGRNYRSAVYNIKSRITTRLTPNILTPLSCDR